MDVFIGTIALFAFPRVPNGWLRCDGSLIAIHEYQPLYSLIGTTYGGDGIGTFGLPDLRGRVPIHTGTGVGLTMRELGELGGAENVTLLVEQYPEHSHLMTVIDNNGSAAAGPSNNAMFGAAYYGFKPYIETDVGEPYVMHASSLSPCGGGNLPHTNVQPSLVMNYCIAVNGIYPSPD